jgi:DNA-binding NarL/FixJ family response regulator
VRAGLADSGEVPATLRALTLLEDLGAAAAVRVVRDRLRQLGVRSVPRGPNNRTRDNPNGLTDRQVAIATLLSEGLTNSEIADRLVLSVRTVDHHVSAILAKLSVHTRREAAEIARSWPGR